MTETSVPWIDLSEHDVRSLLIGVIGFDFGPEPDKKIPEIRESRRAYSNYIADQCRVSPNDVVLDLGSGCGFGTYWLAKRARHVHACDISPAYLSFARRECADLGNVSFHLIKSRKLEPIADGSLDAVCAASVFIHLNLYDMYWYFGELRRVLKPQGRVWLDVCDPEWLDLSTPNQGGALFLQHAKEYAADPMQISGLVAWNTPKAVIGIARHFGFEYAPGGKDPQHLLFVNAGAPARG